MPARIPTSPSINAILNPTEKGCRGDRKLENQRAGDQAQNTPTDPPKKEIKRHSRETDNDITFSGPDRSSDSDFNLSFADNKNHDGKMPMPPMKKAMTPKCALKPQSYRGFGFQRQHILQVNYGKVVIFSRLDFVTVS